MDDRPEDGFMERQEMLIANALPKPMPALVAE